MESIFFTTNRRIAFSDRVCKKLIKLNVSIKDAQHVACARVANADYFITTDRKLLNKLANVQQIRAITPITFIEEQNL